LGAHMGSSALNIHTGHKYCPNGNMGVGPNQPAASARPGVREGDHGPSRRPSEIAHFAGKMLQRSGVPAFGCADGLVSHLRSNVAVEDYPDEALHLRLVGYCGPDEATSRALEHLAQLCLIRSVPQPWPSGPPGEVLYQPHWSDHRGSSSCRSDWRRGRVSQRRRRRRRYGHGDQHTRISSASTAAVPRASAAPLSGASTASVLAGASIALH
jgi:hypothetical protein